MEEEAEKLMAEALPKNFIDYEEYPQTADIQARCVSMIARLYNAPTDSKTDNAVGTRYGSGAYILLARHALNLRGTALWVVARQSCWAL